MVFSALESKSLFQRRNRTKSWLTETENGFMGPKNYVFYLGDWWENTQKAIILWQYEGWFRGIVPSRKLTSQGEYTVTNFLK